MHVHAGFQCFPFILCKRIRCHGNNQDIRCIRKNLIQQNKKEEKVVNLFGPMEKSDPDAENTARTAFDQTVAMAEEKLGLTVFIDKQAMGYHLLRNCCQLPVYRICSLYNLPEVFCTVQLYAPRL